MVELDFYDRFPELELYYANGIFPIEEKLRNGCRSGEVKPNFSTSGAVVGVDTISLLRLNEEGLIEFRKIFRQFILEVAEVNGLRVSVDYTNLIDYELSRIREAQKLLGIEIYKYEGQTKFVFMKNDIGMLHVEVYAKPIPDSYMDEVEASVLAKIALAPKVLSQYDEYSALWAISRLRKDGKQEEARVLWEKLYGYYGGKLL